MGTGTLAQAPTLPPAVWGGPCHPLTKALWDAGGLGDTLLPREHRCSFVHMGHWKEAGGSPGLWWAAVGSRSWPRWDPQGWPCCFEIIVLGLAPMYWFVASLNWFIAFIRCGMSGNLRVLAAPEGTPRLWLPVLVAMRAHMPGAASMALQAADALSQPRPEGSTPEAPYQAFSHSIFPSSMAPAAEQASAALQQEEWEDATCPLLFIQLNQLLSTPAGMEWRETAR